MLAVQVMGRVKHDAQEPSLGAFVKNYPPSFNGENQYEGLVDRVDSWIEDIEKIWEAFYCSEEKKTLLLPKS